jgi:hypothetical protein
VTRLAWLLSVLIFIKLAGLAMVVVIANGWTS